jgi:hypothetical protein
MAMLDNGVDIVPGSGVAAAQSAWRKPHGTLEAEVSLAA